MKELSIEEKAKAYDKAIERAKYYYSTTDSAADIKLIGLMFPELKESEDERMIQYFKDLAPFDKADELYEKYGFSHKDAISWLEKQGGHAKFINGIQVGDKVTRNEDGVLVNLSQLKRVAKKDEKQGEQKPAETEKGAKGNDRENPNSAWSEEDEKQRRQIERIVSNDGCTKKLQEQIHNWFESIKSQSTWKPSEEQMAVLNEVINYAANSELQHWNNFIYTLLKSLREQLKKLREE